MLFSQTLQLDDAEQIEHAQNLVLGYPFPQPPLYSWLSWLLFHTIGTSLLALTLLKYTLVALTGWLTWTASGYLFLHRQTRWLALSAYLLMPSFAWHMHQGFTHTILLGFSIILTLHALFRLHATPNPNNYLYLGLGLGTGLLSKYSFLLFVALLLLAALTIPSYRKLLIHRSVLLSIAIFSLIIAPHGVWVLQHYHEIFGAIDNKLQVTQETSLLEQFYSLGKFATAAVAFVTPLWILYLITHSRKIFTSHKHPQKDNQRLLKHFYLFLILVTIALALFMSMPHFKVRWFHPLMMLFPLWLLSHIEGDTPITVKKLRLIIYTTLTITLLILAIRLIQLNWAPELGHYSRLNRPIIESLEQIPNSLIHSRHLVTEDSFLGAHLLTHYQKHPVTIRSTKYRDDMTNRSKACLWLWDNDTDQPPPQWESRPLQSGSIQIPVAEFSHTLHYALLPSPECH